ncbi:mitochondrial fission regulator 2-like isoform X2 [Trichogramma pretiosum]|uniref:mitochondrial fission regulator 2-like isoform X2 n=1 Tax=Trichogramma pretiosum TaxID=7493 RepID=UPI0006C9626A|nr:mitochondrial fission regulator 2-like isoform X2 [Trichogramma pretiosum]
MEEKKIKYYGKRRSIVRRIGSMLPLKPPPKIYVSVTPLHSMSSSMIDQEPISDYKYTNGFGAGRPSSCCEFRDISYINNGLYQSKPDLLEPISFGSEVRLLALEQELQDLREQISTIVKPGKPNASQANGSSGNSNFSIPPPPPPPLPPVPKTPHIARRASLQDHINEERKKPPFVAQKSMGEILKGIDKVKLRVVEKSPNGGPLKIKRDVSPSPCNDLQEILRRRYAAMHLSQSPDSRSNSPNTTLDDSF